MVANHTLAKIKLQHKKTCALHHSIGVSWFKAIESEFSKPYFSQVSISSNIQHKFFQLILVFLWKSSSAVFFLWKGQNILYFLLNILCGHGLHFVKFKISRQLLLAKTLIMVLVRLMVLYFCLIVLLVIIYIIFSFRFVLQCFERSASSTKVSSSHQYIQIYICLIVFNFVFLFII